MATVKVCITRTVQLRDAKGERVTLSPSEEPIGIDSALAKEGLERGWAKKPVVAKKVKEPEGDDDGSGDGDGTGDPAPGDE